MAKGQFSKLYKAFFDEMGKNLCDKNFLRLLWPILIDMA